MSAVWGQRVAAFATGAALVLTQPPYALFWLLLPSLAALYWLWTLAGRPRDAFLVGWFAGVAYFGFGLVWIAEAFLVQPELFAWMIPIAMPLLAGGLALFWGAGFWAARRLSRGGPDAPVTLALFWMLGEAARSFLLTGFPWALPGYGWIDTPPMQAASLAGITGVTLLTLLAGCLLGAAISGGAALRRGVQGALVLGLVGGMWVYGSVQLAAGMPPDHSSIRIGLVQPNVDQKDKWAPELREIHLRDLLLRTAELTGQGANAVIWPEAATPYLIAETASVRTAIASALGDTAVLIAGGVRVEARGTADERYFNSILVVGPDGEMLGAYDKEHLVPFGEFIPFDTMLTQLGLRALVTLPGGFSHGTQESRIVSPGPVPPFAAMICYEAIFADEIARRSDSFDWMVQVTNDGWFGRSSGPHQHLAQARVRAIERGVPLIRVANTGISATIDARGELRGGIPLGEAGSRLDALPARVAPTFYHRYEDWIFLALMGLTILCSVFLRRIS